LKVLLVSYRREDLLRRCVTQLESYFSTSDLLVVDNHSEESPAIADFCVARGIDIIRNDTNEGFAKAVNAGMRRLGSADPWVLLINPDTEVLIDPRQLTRFTTEKCACITAFNAAGSHPWDCERPIPNPWRSAWEDADLGWIRLPQPFGSRYRTFSDRHRGYLVGCFLIVSTQAWEKIGPFDERFWLYSEETDWCLRAHHLGLDCTVVPVMGYRHEAAQSVVGDAEAEARSAAALRTSRRLFIEKHWGTGGLRSYLMMERTLTAARIVLGSIRRTARGSLQNPDQQSGHLA